MTPVQPELVVVTILDLQAKYAAIKFNDPRRYLLNDRARTMFLANPVAGESDPAQVLAVIDGQLVGRINVIPGSIQQDGQEQRLLWASGYRVDSEFRGRGIGKALMSRMQELDTTFGALGASAMSFPIFKKFGWSLGAASRVVFVRNSLPVVRSKVDHRWAAQAVAAGLNAALRVRRIRSSPAKMAPKGYHADSVSSVPRLYIPGETYGRISFPRSADWMEWVARSVGPDRIWDQYTVHEGDRPMGYFTVSERHHDSASRWGYRDLRLATVKDWQAVDGTRETNHQLALLAVKHAFTRAVDAVEICSPDPKLVADLQRAGGFQRGSMPLFLLAQPGSPLSNDALRSPEEWNFRSADGDYFLF